MIAQDQTSDVLRKEYLARVVKLISPEIRAQMLAQLQSSTPEIDAAFKVAMEQDSKNQQQQKLLLGAKRKLEPPTSSVEDNDAIVRAYLASEDDQIPSILYERCHRYKENIPLWYLSDVNLELAAKNPNSTVYKEVYDKETPLQSEKDFLIEARDYIKLSSRWIKLCSDSEHEVRYASIPMSEFEQGERKFALENYHSVLQKMMFEGSTNWSKQTAMLYGYNVRKLLYFSFFDFHFDTSKISNLLLQHVEKILTNHYHSPEETPNTYWTSKIKAEEGIHPNY